MTGGGGFIGSHLSRLLISRGHRVRILDTRIRPLTKHPSTIEYLQGDLRDQAAVARAVSKVDGCFHLAAKVPRHTPGADTHSGMSTNITGTAILLNSACSNGIRFVLASSSRVYGDSTEEPLSEHITSHPVCGYGKDKLVSELHLEAARKQHGLPGVALRLFDVYGPGQDPEAIYARMVSKAIELMATKREAEVPCDSAERLDLLHVEDAVNMLHTSMEQIHNTPPVLNACTGRAVKAMDLIRCVNSISTVSLRPLLIPERSPHVFPGIGNPDLMQKTLGIKAEVTLEEGLRKLLSRAAPAMAAPYHEPDLPKNQ